MRLTILFVLLTSLCFGQGIKPLNVISAARYQPMYQQTGYLIAGTTSTTSITLTITSNGADKYIIERSTSADFSSSTDISTDGYNGTDLSYVNTGLTINTRYYYRVKARKSGYYDSEWVTTDAKTFPYSPVLFYLMSGLGHGDLDSGGTTCTDDQYGTMSGTQCNFVDVFKSIINTSGQTATFTADKAQVATSTRNNAYKVVKGPSIIDAYSFSSNVTLAGDFTIMARVQYSGTVNQVLVGKADGANFVRFLSTTQIQTRIGGSVWNIALPQAADNTARWYNFVFRRTGSRVTVGFYNEGNYSENGRTIGTNSITFDRFLGDGISGPSWATGIENFVVEDSYLSVEDIAATFNLMKVKDVILAPQDNTIVPVVTAWSSLSSSLLVDNTLGAAATGASNRVRCVAQGDYAYFLTHKKANSTYYLEDTWGAYKFSDATIYRKDLGVPFNNTDVHNNGSISLIGNYLYHFENNVHYDQFTKSDKLIVKRSGPKLDVTQVNTMPSGNGFANIAAGKLQYHQGISIGNTIYVFAQEFCSTTWLSEATEVNIIMLTSTDGGNYWEKVTIARSEASSQFLYPNLIYSEDGVLRLGINNIQTADRYRYCFYLESLDFGKTWRNATNSTSKVVTYSPLTRTELIANYIVINANALAGNGKMSHWFYDSGDDEVYALGGNGSDTDLLFYNRTGTGSFSSQTMDADGKTLVYTWLSSDGDNIPVVQKTTTNNYFAYPHEVNGGNWFTDKYSTTNAGGTWTYGSKLSTDDTKKHQRMLPTWNMEYQTHKLLLFMRQVDATGVTEGSVHFIDVTSP